MSLTRAHLHTLQLKAMLCSMNFALILLFFVKTVGVVICCRFAGFANHSLRLAIRGCIVVASLKACSGFNATRQSGLLIHLESCCVAGMKMGHGIRTRGQWWMGTGTRKTITQRNMLRKKHLANPPFNHLKVSFRNRHAGSEKALFSITLHSAYAWGLVTNLFQSYPPHK
jgi:hypothetical protein